MRLAALLLLVACSSDPNQTLGTCGSAWDFVSTYSVTVTSSTCAAACEVGTQEQQSSVYGGAACDSQAYGGSGDSCCEYPDGDGSTWCVFITAANGERGCCVDDSTGSAGIGGNYMNAVIDFVPCE